MGTVISIPVGPAAPVTAHERRDASRNRERLLTAARELISEGGTEGLTIDRLAERAGLGKGTVFRRFGSRAGLMLTLLSESEAAFQARFMFGPPPLGPGAPALDRLIAFGTERIKYLLEFGDLALEAEKTSQGEPEPPAAALWHHHVELLLREQGFGPDPWLMARFLNSTLRPHHVLNLVRVHQVDPDRLGASWTELVTRVAGGT